MIKALGTSATKFRSFAGIDIGTPFRGPSTAATCLPKASELAEVAGFFGHLELSS
jgi:hypothetical protein